MPYESFLDLELSEKAAGIYTTTSASIHGKDLRAQPEVVFYNFDSASPAKLPNATPVHKLLTGRLAKAFEEQGLQLSVDAPVILTLEILQLQSVISRTKAHYRTETHCSIRFIVNNRGTTLTKDYTRQEDQESLTRPKLHDIEAILEEQISEILELILADKQVSTLIQKTQ